MLQNDKPDIQCILLHALLDTCSFTYYFEKLLQLQSTLPSLSVDGYTKKERILYRFNKNKSNVILNEFLLTKCILN